MRVGDDVYCVIGVGFISWGKGGKSIHEEIHVDRDRFNSLLKSVVSYV